MGVSHSFNGSLQPVLLRRTGRPGRWLGGAGGSQNAFGLTLVGFRVGVAAGG